MDKLTKANVGTVLWDINDYDSHFDFTMNVLVPLGKELGFEVTDEQIDAEIEDNFGLGERSPDIDVSEYPFYVAEFIFWEVIQFLVDTYCESVWIGLDGSKVVVKEW